MIPSKQKLRSELRKRRRDHVAALPEQVRNLILNRPPAPVVELLKDTRTLGIYHPVGAEAPTLGWARWFFENGWTLALPRFADRDAPMEFRAWGNPWEVEGLEPGPHGGLQPKSVCAVTVPDAIVVPLVGFTADGHRLGQGGGHYDRWIDAHPHVTPVGLAWDVQLVNELPLEPHDRTLAAVVTPTRIYWSTP